MLGTMAKKALNPWPNRLKALRVRLGGISMTAAAALVGASLRTWSYWENGKFQPDRRFQKAINDLINSLK